MRSTSPLHRMLIALGSGAVLALASCGPGEPATIPRETFIAAYVELRMAALERDDATLPEADRDRILAKHGVTAQDLVSFAEVRSREPEFMRDVWNEIDARLDVNPAEATPAFPDSTEGQ